MDTAKPEPSQLRSARAANASVSDLDAGRAALRDIQSTDWGDEPLNWALLESLDIAEHSQQLLLEEWSQLAQTFDGEYLWDGPYKYPVDTERARWAGVMAILDRVEPGPYEDPRYFAMVAKQAAAIEVSLIGRSLVLCELPENVPTSAAIRYVPMLQEPGTEGRLPGCGRQFDWRSFDDGDFSGLLVGTTHSARLDAFSTTLGKTVLVPLSAGILDTQYWAAKAVAGAVRTVKNDDGASYRTAFEEDVVRANLAEDASPVELLYETFESWLYRGRPFPEVSEAPSPEETLPLSLMIQYAKRFLLAHEYGHIFMDLLRPSAAWSPSDWIVSRTTQEYRADLLGFEAVGHSGALLDHIPPNISLGGAALALRVYEICDEARSIALTGKVESPSHTSTHPTFDQRLSQLHAYYRRRHGSHLDQEALELEFWRIGAQTTVLGTIWEQVRPRLLHDQGAGRVPHDMWLQATDRNDM